MRRRDVLKVALAGPVLMATAAYAQPQGCPSDGTPVQFSPKKPADPDPVKDDIGKYPSCPYCGMDRKKFHHSRMLVHYSDDLPDPTCSLHCATISLSINLDRGPKAIYVADNGSADAIKPLIDVSNATFLVGSSLKGVMTMRSKVAYGTGQAAKAAQEAHGGETMAFDQALLAAHVDMAQDTNMIRKNREERRKRMQRP